MDGATSTTDSETPQRPVRVRLLGGDVDLVTPAQVMAFTAAVVYAVGKAIVANHNLHSLHLIQRSEAMRRLYAMADLIEADSTPLIAWGRQLGLPIEAKHRCTYLDWRDDFWRMANDSRWRVFYLGGAPGVAEDGARSITARYPGVELATQHGYFDTLPGSPGNSGVVDAINAFAPHILLVGMGMPRQEAWIADNAAGLKANVTFSVGAAFDYEAGVQNAAPRWMGPLGVEWLYRFASDPARLFTRYFVEPWSLVGPALADLRAAWKTR